MSKGYQPPPGVEIAALKGKQRQTTGLDLMRPGDGTPWEDRGAQGLVKAFFSTCVKSITSPAVVLDHIRRPDTTNEARQFAIGCCVLWLISIAGHGIVWNVMHPPTPEQVEYFEGYVGKSHGKMVVLGLLGGALMFFLGVSFASRAYRSLISSELKNNAPHVLIYNIFCYALGPSLLALVPVIGPPLAIALIFVVWCVAGGKRLYVSWRGAIVAAVLSMAAVLIVLSAVLFLGNIFLNTALDLREPTREEMGLPPEPTGAGPGGAVPRPGVQP